MCGALRVEGDGEARISGVSIDSRTVAPGNLFVPLAGETFDGHDFAAQAAERGAAAVFWQEGKPNPPEGVPLVVVDDPLAALQSLAAAYRRQLPVRVIGITGSNGKTTTKEMVAAALSTTYRTIKNEGNLNNHIGLPLTLLRLDETTEMAVVEMGMSGRGEIELLTKLALPEAAIITNVGEAHLQQLGSRLEIARAKTEIAHGLSAGDLLVYNGDEPLLEQSLTEFGLSDDILRFRFGRSPGNDYYPSAIMLSEHGTLFHLNGGSGPTYSLPLMGEHNVVNALAAIAVAKFMGVMESDIVRGLETMKPVGMRAEIVKGKTGLTIINDTYNSSPTSVRAVLELFYSLKGFRKKIVVLGDMLELGSEEKDYHRQVGSEIDASRIDAIYTYGELARHIALGAADHFSDGKVRSFLTKDDLIRSLGRELSPEDAVLVKASRGMKMEEVVEALKQITI
jgi:UDP-N-acetylmuramoyl-tripeptide--D-alanyl-D-alanine ligase